MRFFLSILFFLICFIACHTKSTEDSILPPKKFGAVFWDIQKANAYATEYIRMDTLKNDSIELVEMKRVIFVKHEISESVFEKSFVYYKEHPAELSAIIDTLEAGQKKKQKWSEVKLNPE
jgi:hypothetical protein